MFCDAVRVSLAKCRSIESLSEILGDFSAKFSAAVSVKSNEIQRNPVKFRMIFKFCRLRFASSQFRLDSESVDTLCTSGTCSFDCAL